MKTERNNKISPNKLLWVEQKPTKPIADCIKNAIEWVIYVERCASARVSGSPNNEYSVMWNDQRHFDLKCSSGGMSLSQLNALSQYKSDWNNLTQICTGTKINIHVSAAALRSRNRHGHQVKERERDEDRTRAKLKKKITIFNRLIVLSQKLLDSFWSNRIWFNEIYFISFQTYKIPLHRSNKRQRKPP